MGFNRQRVNRAQMNMFAIPVGTTALQANEISHPAERQAIGPIRHQILRPGPVRFAVSLQTSLLNRKKRVKAGERDKIRSGIRQRHLQRVSIHGFDADGIEIQQHPPARQFVRKDQIRGGYRFAKAAFGASDIHHEDAPCGAAGFSGFRPFSRFRCFRLFRSRG